MCYVNIVSCMSERLIPVNEWGCMLDTKAVYYHCCCCTTYAYAH